VDREQRRAAGAFYTPEAVARELVERTVESGEELPTVVDPACGDGALLVAALAELVRRYGEEARGRIARECVFGVDVDPLAVAAARRRIAAAAGVDEAEVMENIRCGDAILGEDAPAELGRAIAWGREFPRAFARGGFSAVIGNPPYVDAQRMTRQSAALRRYCAQRYEAAAGNWDLFCVFVELGLKLCAPGGRCGLIVPNKLASSRYAEAARRVLAREGRLVRVQDYSEVAVFAAQVYPLVVIAEKSGAGADDVVVYERMRIEDGAVTASERRELPLRELAAEPARPWAIVRRPDASEVVERVRRVGRPLGEIAEVWGAATVAEAYALAELLSEGDAGLRVVNSGTIDRYECLWGHVRLRYLGRTFLRPVVAEERLAELPARRLRQARTPKVIVSGMTRSLEAIADVSGELLAGKSTTIVTWESDLRLLLALLNSRVTDLYYQQVFGGDRLGRGYLRVGPPQLRQVPVFDPRSGQEATVERIVALVGAMLAEGYTAERDAEIEALVAELYGVSLPDD
jgi:SAM-dependent methyltransferase